MLTALIPLVVLAQSAPKLDLHVVASGAMPKIGFYIPQRLNLSPTPPAGIKNAPADADGFGTWDFNGKSLSVAEVATGGVPSKILIDESGTGNFQGAIEVPWKAMPADPREPNGFKLFRSEVSLHSMIGGSQKVAVSFYRFDPADTRRAALKSTLLYYPDYALDGTVTLGGKKYHAMLVDVLGRGSFDGPVSADPKAIPSKLLLIDRNGDNQFSNGYEWFRPGTPFNIGGTTYEISGLHGSGATATIVRSSKTVAEIPVPAPLPTFHAGSKVAAFTAVDQSGKTVHFPEDFKGKVVMLDFWATWCGPCMQEVPTVVKVYNQMHPKGFEILGISLDNAQTISHIGPVTKDKGMTWDQIADGKYWDAAIGKLYGVQAIPQAYIVDGDTGTVVAEGDAIRGENLLPAVQKAIGALKSPPK